MDLSTAAPSAMSPGASTGSSSSSGGGGGGSANGTNAVACPVCTLYLREGISLQKHLDTHPKEQVIEALIRASSGSGISALLGQQVSQQNNPSVTTQQATVTQPSQPTTPSPGSTPTPSPHVPHAQSPYPIGPIYECPPINTMIPPPQYASFSYQQFVNNGTMMIPAQYAMAQAQAPQTSQMMQMLYSPYGMYHQQQIPTVQMISAPPMMPTSPAAIQRMRPPIPTTTANVTITSVNETTTSTTISSPPQQSTTRTSCTQQESTTTQQIETQKQQNIPEIIPGPDRILPDLEMPVSPEQHNEDNDEDRTNVGSSEHNEQQTQNVCVQSEQHHEVDQYQRDDPPTLVSSSCTDNADDDKTERILPDIEDNEEIESLIVRDTSRVDTHNETEQIQLPETIEPMDTSSSVHDEDEDVVSKELTESIVSDKVVDSCRESEEKSENSVESNIVATDKPTADAPTVLETDTAPAVEKPEIEHISRMLVNIESEFSNAVELTNRYDEPKDLQEDVLSVSALDKQMEEDESTNISYPKTTLEPIECKIIVAHEDTDVSSVASSESHCESEIRKIITSSSYSYKYSQSAPTSPIAKEKFHRSLSRASLRSDFDRSNENLCPYPVGFEATTLQDYLKDNYNDEDMELEEHSFIKENGGIIQERSSSVSVLKARRSKVPSSTSSYCQMEEDEDDSDIESCGDEKDDEEDDEDDNLLLDAVSSRRSIDNDVKDLVHKEDCKAIINLEIKRQHDQPTDFRTHVDNQFPLDLHPITQQQQSTTTLAHETYTSQNLLACADPSTSTDSKSYSNSNKSVIQKPSTELLNINEDAHAGPMNVFEFDGLQILVPSTFISESSQKAVSGTSQQSMSSSENGVGIDEEVKSVNMRADETMPPRGELSEQESNGCTEQSAWQLYMGQESSRMSTSYDLMARESWEESEGSDHEDNNGGPLLDSRSLATHFTSSLFLDRDRKTPTRRIFKCSHCPELFECPKERRVHSAMVHKEAGPSNSCSNDNMDQSELKDIKLLESRTNVFEDIFVPGGLHAQQVYHHQQPLLHQLQPPQHSSSAKVDADGKIDALHLSAVSEVVCNLCNQRFTSEKSLQLHHRRMHSAEPSKRIRETAKCQICNEEFASVASFNLHLKIHPLECGQCGKYFYRKQNFKLHMKRHLGIKPFPCTLCDKAFLTKQKLDEHTNGHTGNAPVKCNLCNETFRRYSNLTQHKNRHHLNIKKKLKDYICHCGEVFHTKKKLAWHKETHDEKPKACTYCNERFIHMASLTRHMRRAHNRRFVPDAQRENENVECTICKCIYLRSSLAVHMRVHNGEKPYECQVCSKAFSTKWNLQLHKWTHAARSTKPFKCNQCSAAFYRHSDYTAHMNSHRNVRPYTCNYCGAQFIRKYNCLRHVKEHEENKQYTCEVCNKTFHRSYYLKEHLRVHSGQRPYTCHICGKSSSTKSNHNKHVRIHHAREPVNTEN